MKLDPFTLAYIQNVVETALLVHIDSVIIEPDKIRAVDDDRLVVIFQDHDVPVLPFRSIGLNRIDIFMSRYQIAKSCDNVEIEATLDDAKEFARALTMKGKGVKIDYRCANPATIAAPKTLNDTVKYRITLTPEAVLLMSKGASAMKADEIEFVGDPVDGVSFKMEDINKDTFVHTFASSYTLEGATGMPSKFAHRYPVKHLLTLFKQCPDGDFFLTSKGMIKVVVNKLDLYIPPRT